MFLFSFVKENQKTFRKNFVFHDSSISWLGRSGNFASAPSQPTGKKSRDTKYLQEFFGAFLQEPTLERGQRPLAGFALQGGRKSI